MMGIMTIGLIDINSAGVMLDPQWYHIGEAINGAPTSIGYRRFDLVYLPTPCDGPSSYTSMIPIPHCEREGERSFHVPAKKVRHKNSSCISLNSISRTAKVDATGLLGFHGLAMTPSNRNLTVDDRIYHYHQMLLQVQYTPGEGCGLHLRSIGRLLNRVLGSSGGLLHVRVHQCSSQSDG